MGTSAYNRTGLGVSEPIVHAPVSGYGSYKYRSSMGMVPSAEFDVFFDDFNQAVATNVPTGWTGAVIDTGATAVIDTTAALGATGALLMSDATVSEGVAIYGSKSVQLTSGKKFFMEVRFRTDDVADNTFFFGLSDLTATTNPEDLYTTAAANLAVYGFLDPAGSLTTYLTDKGNAGTAAANGTRAPTADQWDIYAIEYDGGSTMNFYLNGLLDASTTTTVPTGVALAPFVAVRNGNGAGGNNNYVDFVRYVIER